MADQDNAKPSASHPACTFIAHDAYATVCPGDISRSHALLRTQVFLFQILTVYLSTRAQYFLRSVTAPRLSTTLELTRQQQGQQRPQPYLVGMLCKVCVAMLRGGRGELWGGTHDVTFDHHNTTTSLRKSREADCSICKSLANALWREVNLLEDHAISITAALKPLSGGFSLDFDINRVSNRAYLLKEIDPNQRRLRSLTSFDSSSAEVIRLAQNWIKGCKCADGWKDPGKRWYPKRLLDLQDIRNIPGFEDRNSLTFLSKRSDIQQQKVYLVDTNEFFQSSGAPFTLSAKSSNGDRKKMSRIEMENHRYVTLSHCWGKPKSVQGRLRLDSTTEDRFKREGIELRQLSKTFRDAILLACHMEKVGFIWIDSMCIMQRNETRDGDWLEQSGQMSQIYRQSFLNISATAAIDGDQGLFFQRRPEDLWEDEINVTYSGTNVFGSQISGSTYENQLKKCTLIDVAFWDELVESAPVNRRGWVLQERLLAPRVLHFCRNQIAWECAEFEDAEAHPEMNPMNPTLRAELATKVDEGRLKDLTPLAGLALRSNRLKGLPDPDKHMADLGIYELWKHIVEAYSRTQLTVSSDKLIALSGIARRFCEGEPKLFTVTNTYIAGIWRNNIESQLLWQVNERFSNGEFENPARRDVTRAPSFSWASIDTPHGITYPDVTDYGAAGADKWDTWDQDQTEESYPEEELLLEVLDHRIVLSDPDNEFGLVSQAKLLLRPRYLKAIELHRHAHRRGVPYSWCLKPDKSASKALQPTSNSAPYAGHANLYLDAPESDVDIFLDGAYLYCMPVAYGERTVRKPFRYLYCLLLKYEKQIGFDTGGGNTSLTGPPVSMTQYPMFRRVGITKLSNHLDQKGQEALMSKEYNEKICLC